MATNTGKGHRNGAVKGKTQTFNPTTGQYVKRDASTGRFEATKKDGAPFKGVTKEKRTIQHNPSIPKSNMDAARKAVNAYLKSRRAA